MQVTPDANAELTRFQREHPGEKPFFRRPVPLAVAAGTEAPLWTPAVEVFEDATTIRVVAELAGVQRRDVTVSLEGNRLTIAGTKRQGEEEPHVKVHRHERVYGDFKRTFRLGSVVDFANVSATYDVGVLTVALPKAESAKLHAIPIRD
jgi:HSP20 family protein